jgi:hypothetical protein
MSPEMADKPIYVAKSPSAVIKLQNKAKYSIFNRKSKVTKKIERSEIRRSEGGQSQS